MFVPGIVLRFLSEFFFFFKSSFFSHLFPSFKCLPLSTAHRAARATGVLSVMEKRFLLGC